MKATEQYFPVVLFIMLYKVVLSFESVDEILKCDHSNESYGAVLSCGAVYYAVEGDSSVLLWLRLLLNILHHSCCFLLDTTDEYKSQRQTSFPSLSL